MKNDSGEMSLETEQMIAKSLASVIDLKLTVAQCTFLMKYLSIADGLYELLHIDTPEELEITRESLLKQIDTALTENHFYMKK